MFTEGFEQLFKMNKNSNNPLAEWNKMTTEMCKRITEQNVEMLGQNVTRISDQLKRLSNIKKPEDFINLQKEIISEDITATIETVQKIMHTSMENMEEISKLCGNCREPVSTATKTTEKTSK